MWVVFHKQCLDGTASAASVLKKYPKATIFSLANTYSIEEIKQLFLLRNQMIYLLDIILQKNDLQILLDNNNSVFVIDHHISNAKEIEFFKVYSNFHSIFDINHSASYLTWSYMHNVVPDLVQFVEDRDLWKKKYPETDVICHYLFTKVLDKPDEFLKYIELPIEEIYKKGIVYQENIQFYIHKILQESKPLWVEFGSIFKKYKVPCLNSNLFISELGEEIAKKYDGIACIFSISESMIKLSFRSIEGTKITAKEVAEYLGGGGHKHAAGAKLPLKTFLKKIK